MSNEEFVFAPVHATVLLQEGDDLFEEAITPACDFCLDTRVEWEYDCEQFLIEEIGFGSDGAWLACDRCSQLIETGDFGGLSARSIRSWIRRHQVASQEMIDEVGQIHQGFFDHRSGVRKKPT